MGEIFELTPVKMQGGKPKTTAPDLTQREIQLIQMIANGHSSYDLARLLYLSKHTIDSHRKNILRKLNASNIIEAVAFGFRNKIIE